MALISVFIPGHRRMKPDTPFVSIEDRGPTSYFVFISWLGNNLAYELRF